MWHVSFRSGVATLRTAIHLLLTYLLTALGHEASYVVASTELSVPVPTRSPNGRAMYGDNNVDS